MKNFLRYTRMMLEYRRLLIAAVFGVILDALCQLGGISTLTWVVRQLFEAETTVKNLAAEKVQPLAEKGVDLQWVVELMPSDPWSGLAVLLGVIMALAIIGSCGRFMHEYFTITVSLRTVMRLRKRVFTRLVHLPMTIVAREKTAEQASRIVRDCELLGRGFNALMARSMRGIIVGIVLLGGAFYNDWKLTVAFLIVLPPIVIMIQKFGKKIRRASRKALHQYGVMLGALTESMQALRIVKVYQTEGYERRRFNVINRDVLAQQMRARSARALSSPTVETLSMLGLVIVVLIAAWGLYEQGRETGTLLGVMFMLGASANSFRQLTGLNNTLQEASAAADNITEVLDMPVESGPQGADSKRKLPRHRASVEFDHVTFTYPEAKEPALRDVSLKVPHGTVCAVVGANGSGKSTLLSLLPRLYEPDSGRILIDGEDIATGSLRSLRRQLAVVTQDTVLFDGTIAQNVAYGSWQVTRDKIIDACRRAHAHDFILNQPDGYETQIGERGQRLSGGQRQRLAIARAILRDPAILILDEATSQIDSDSESQINEALSEFARQRTTFVIAHRLSTVVDADMIVVMSGGAIASVGKHSELLEQSDAYRVLCRTQLHGARI